MSPLITIAEVLHVTGIVLSTFCVIVQIVIYILVPCSRKLDQKLLTQMTVARYLRVLSEYFLKHAGSSIELSRYLAHILYACTEVALLCWMVIFTKHLYDKLINVFAGKYNFTLMSVTIWTVSFLMSPWLVLVLYLEESKKIDRELKIYTRSCWTYNGVKTVVLLVNLFLFCKIFALAIKTRKERQASLLKTCIVSFALFSISSAQAILEICIMNLHTFFAFDLKTVWVITCLLSAYQIIHITGIFVILVQSVSEESLFKTIAKQFKKIIKNV